MHALLASVSCTFHGWDQRESNSEVLDGFSSERNEDGVLVPLHARFALANFSRQIRLEKEARRILARVCVGLKCNDHWSEEDIPRLPE